VQLAESQDDAAARLDASLILEHVTGLSRSLSFAFPERMLAPGLLDALDTLLRRRCEGEPLAYLTGKREFWSLPLRVSPGSLVPRPETELLVEQALASYPCLPEGCIIDLGTGSGAIALALAQEIRDRLIIAVERHSEALQVARYNVHQFGHGRVHLVQGSWVDAVMTHSAALIVANPPYLASMDPHMPQLRHEPRTALVSGQTGLEDLHRIIDGARRAGRQGSLLLLEHGSEQGSAVRSLLRQYQYRQVHTVRDLAGLDRVSHGYLPTGPIGEKPA
jgi:release factor glutamine methyltransferase